MGGKVGGNITHRFLSSFRRINYSGQRSLGKDGGKGGMKKLFSLLIV